MGFLSVFIFGVAFGSVLSVPISSSTYRKLTPKEANRLANWNAAEEVQNPWEVSGQYQGDIILPALRLSTRNGQLDLSTRWPNNEIPYHIEDVFTTDEVKFIDTAVQAFAESTNSCFVVRRRNLDEVDYVNVTGIDGKGCFSSYIGRQGGIQELNLQRNLCFQNETIVHEFLHAAGFFHEQASTDRDDYITIMFGNVQPGMEFNFNKQDNNTITSFGQPYDYYSVMHYRPYMFSKDCDPPSQNECKPTIITKDPKMMDVIGQATQMSKIDIIKLKLMYNCP